MEIPTHSNNQNSSELPVQDKINQQLQTASKGNVNYLFPGLVVLISSIAFGLGGYYFGKQNYSNVVRLSENTSVVSETTQTTTSFPSLSPTPNISWKRTGLMGIYSFEYPVGWHVASNWNTPMTILIDPEPINGAPRGGPSATITISDWNGLPNPEEKYQELQKLAISNLKPEFINEKLIMDFGDVYHVSGKAVGPMMEDAAIENYIFMLVPNPNDGPNKHVIEIQTIGASQYSDTLKHIVTSFKLNYMK